MTATRHIYGRHPVQELLRAHPQAVQRLLVARASETRLQSLTALAVQAGVRVEPASRSTLDAAVGAVPHQGVVAIVDAFGYVELADLLVDARTRRTVLLVLDQVQDPHNVGSLVRSAHALGAHGVVMPKDRACEVTSSVVKASAGATAHLPIARVTNLRRALDQMKDAGMWIVGTVPEGGQPLPNLDLTGAIAIVVGSEGAGMRRGVTEACDHLARIPMAGAVGSVNASVAGAITLYEVMRQRGLSP